MAKIIRIPSAYVFESKVAGVSHCNEDGTSRQEIIRAEVRENDWLELEPEPQNPYDPNAIRVKTRSGKQIGYLEKALAEKVRSALDNDTPAYIRVIWVNGKELLGVGIRVELVN